MYTTGKILKNALDNIVSETLLSRNQNELSLRTVSENISFVNL